MSEPQSQESPEKLKIPSLNQKQNQYKIKFKPAPGQQWPEYLLDINATFSSLKSSANFHLIQDIKLENILFEYDFQYQELKAVEMSELQATVFITVLISSSMFRWYTHNVLRTG